MSTETEAHDQRLIAVTDEATVGVLRTAIDLGAALIFEVPAEEQDLDAALAEGPFETIWIPSGLGTAAIRAEAERLELEGLTSQAAKLYEEADDLRASTAVMLRCPERPRRHLTRWAPGDGEARCIECDAPLDLTAEQQEADYVALAERYGMVR